MGGVTISAFDTNKALLPQFWYVRNLIAVLCTVYTRLRKCHIVPTLELGENFSYLLQLIFHLLMLGALCFGRLKRKKLFFIAFSSSYKHSETIDQYPYVKSSEGI